MNGNQAVYLSKAAALFPSSGDLCHLKSHFLWVSCGSGARNLAMTSTMCPNCCQVWSDGKFSLKLKSSSSPGPRMLKILQKTEKTSQKLNRVETSLLKRYNRNIRNRMALLCLICKKETTVQCQKQIVVKPKTTDVPMVELDTPTSRKKKKRDRFAGLNASAVISASPLANARTPKQKIMDCSAGLNASTVISASPSPLITNSKIRCNATPVQVHTISRGGRNPTPIDSKNQAHPINVKAGLESNKQKYMSHKQKMNALRLEVKEAEQYKIREEQKALLTRNLNIRKNNKLQMFLKKSEKDVQLEDRINSLLQV